MKFLPKILTLCILLTPGYLLAQNSFERKLTKQLSEFTGANQGLSLRPNWAAKAVLTPTAWGSRGTFLFGGVGMAYPQNYHSRAIQKADMIVTGGIATGNAQKAVSVAAFFNVNDVSNFSNYSYNLVVSRNLGRGSSISAGALHLFANKVQSDAGSTYYAAFSKSIQSLPSSTPGISRLCYTIGVGNGRFRDKSPLDQRFGRGRYGTSVFANISYEIIERVNLNAEWSGLNLGFSTGLRPVKNLPGIVIGIADVTRSSGDRAHLVLGIGTSLSLTSFTK